MYSKELPTIEDVKKRYEITFEKYNILMYHPVTTEVNKIKEHARWLVDEILKTNEDFVVIYPNNDEGSEYILEEYERIKDNEHFKVFPSMRFEYFLSLLHSAECMVGNSSSGIRETGIYGIPTVDVGTRQNGRYDSQACSHIVHIDDGESISKAISDAKNIEIIKSSYFGDGNSDKIFHDILTDSDLWKKHIQKRFIDVDF